VHKFPFERHGKGQGTKAKELKFQIYEGRVLLVFRKDNQTRLHFQGTPGLISGGFRMFHFPRIVVLASSVKSYNFKSYQASPLRLESVYILRYVEGNQKSRR
jgi:hypothetical protein